MLSLSIFSFASKDIFRERKMGGLRIGKVVGVLWGGAQCDLDLYILREEAI